MAAVDSRCQCATDNAPPFQILVASRAVVFVLTEHVPYFPSGIAKLGVGCLNILITNDRTQRPG